MILNQTKKQKGFILSSVLVFVFIAVIIVSGLIGWFAVTIKTIRNLVQKEQSLHIAEAGAEYYRWNLVRNPDDIYLGMQEGEPVIKDYYDKEGNLVGQFSLLVHKNANIVTLESTGSVLENPKLARTLRVKYSRPSFSDFSFISDSSNRFGEGTEVFGRVHSNNGIRFDGLAHNLFTSAKYSYDDPDHSGSYEFGVHTHVSPVDPYPPADVPERLDVFRAGRDFPVEFIDFDAITGDLSEIKTATKNGQGMYFPPSGKLGYVVVLKTNDTFDLYKVTQFENSPGSCVNQLDQEGWETWSYKQNDLSKGATFVANYPITNQNMMMFFEDHVWVQGKINTAKVTIVAGTFPDIPTDRKNIIINNDLLYTNYDGKDEVLLIAQNNIHVGLMSEDDLRIDAGLIAQNGRVGRYYYSKPGGGQTCATEKTRASLTLYGMIASRGRYGFAYTDQTGYLIRKIIFDPNLSLNLPPIVPVTSELYRPISWEEISK